MKAFLLSLVVLLVVAIGSGYLLNGLLSSSAQESFTSTSTRL